jgi:NAD(P)-dependent dehydrogenase (short-subunit alcohol dehydrogenase family)
MVLDRGLGLSFEGRVAVVTGAGGGLGRAYARELARRGAQVVVNDIGGSVAGTGTAAAPAEMVARDINAEGGIAVADANSVATPEGAEAIVANAREAFGRLDIVVNNAGILRDESFHRLTTEAWEAVLGVHLTGTMLLSRAAFITMREQGYGRIVNTTSSAGLFGNFGQASYGAAKMGVIGLTRVLAIEGATRGIKVNAISPGAMTRMTEPLMGDLAGAVDSRPELVAPVVAFLSHERCNLTGEVLSAKFGRVSRVFVGTASGYFNGDLTAEDVQEHLAEILDDEALAFPTNLEDEFRLILKDSATSRPA